MPYLLLAAAAVLIITGCALITWPLALVAVGFLFGLSALYLNVPEKTE